MTSSRIRQLTIGLPILSAIVAATSVGLQYYETSRDAQELKRVTAEINRLAPNNTEVYDPASHDTKPL